MMNKSGIVLDGPIVELLEEDAVVPPLLELGDLVGLGLHLLHRHSLGHLHDF